MKCWGEAEDGALGLGVLEDQGDEPGEMGKALSAVDLGNGRRVAALSSLDDHVCALLDDGAIKCWGGNATGALGTGDNQTRGLHPGDMGDALEAVDLGVGRTASQVAAGVGFTCAFLDDGTVRCWGQVPGGDNAVGDEPQELGEALPVVRLGAGEEVSALAAGDGHACVLLTSGAVRCWGSGAAGRLGQENTTGVDIDQEAALVNLGTGRSATAISAGKGFTCVVLDDGGVACWGDNEYGQLGTGDTLDRGDDPGEMGDGLVRVDLGEGMTAHAVAAGWSHACAIADDGTTRCWGRNDSGYLGTSGSGWDGRGVVDLGESVVAESLAAGGSHSCAVLEGGELKCWGYNFFGQLGQGDWASRGTGPGNAPMGDNLPPISL